MLFDGHRFLSSCCEPSCDRESAFCVSTISFSFHPKFGTFEEFAGLLESSGNGPSLSKICYAAVEDKYVNALGKYVRLIRKPAMRHLLVSRSLSALSTIQAAFDHLLSARECLFVRAPVDAFSGPPDFDKPFSETDTMWSRGGVITRTTEETRRNTAISGIW